VYFCCWQPSTVGSCCCWYILMSCCPLCATDTPYCLIQSTYAPAQIAWYYWRPTWKWPTCARNCYPKYLVILHKFWDIWIRVVTIRIWRLCFGCIAKFLNTCLETTPTSSWVPDAKHLPEWILPSRDESCATDFRLSADMINLLRL
jgi:hypothetical protein